MRDARPGGAPALTRERLAFLHGDLCLTTKAVAELFRITEDEIARARHALRVKWCYRTYGEITLSSFRELARSLRFDPDELEPRNIRGQWHRMRGILGRELQRLAREKALPWAEIDAFLVRLPGAQRAAEVRVTEERLRFLYGDLGAAQAEIMDILDTTEHAVRFYLVHHDIERHGQYHPELDDRSLDALARRLGTEWPKYWRDRTRTYGCWPTVKREVRDGLARLAREGRADLSTLDGFITQVPRIVGVEQRRSLAARARTGSNLTGGLPSPLSTSVTRVALPSVDRHAAPRECLA